jgi:Ala-tRNA(Pro) deacylase
LHLQQEIGGRGTVAQATGLHTGRISAMLAAARQPRRPLPRTIAGLFMPRTPQDLFAFLDGLGISVTTHHHEPLHTVAESKRLRGRIAGAHTKNLFLKDRKDSYFLLTVEEEAEVDLKTVHHAIGAAGRVSFGRPDALMRLLGVVPGAVTLFGAVNDEERRVKVVIDSALARERIINAHPLVNTATTSIAFDDLLRFLRATGHEPFILNIATASPHGVQQPVEP